jgi:hypothetical protein
MNIYIHIYTHIARSSRYYAQWEPFVVMGYPLSAYLSSPPTILYTCRVDTYQGLKDACADSTQWSASTSSNPACVIRKLASFMDLIPALQRHKVGRPESSSSPAFTFSDHSPAVLNGKCTTPSSIHTRASVTHKLSYNHIGTLHCRAQAESSFASRTSTI